MVIETGDAGPPNMLSQLVTERNRQEIAHALLV